MIRKRGPSKSQSVRGDGAVGVQVEGDSNTITIFAAGSELVLDRPHKRRGTGAPGDEVQFLRTEWRATTLVGRDDDLAALARWRKSDPLVAVRCITGRAGSGKTRLAIEACEAAEKQRWTAGFVSGDELRRFDEAQNLGQRRSAENTLIVVDEAATSADILKKWFTALARRLPPSSPPKKLRILLLERHADADSDYGWWAELKRSENMDHAGVGDLVGAERPMPLPVLAEVEDRRALFTEAMVLAAGFLDKPALSPAQPGEDQAFDHRLADDRLENEPLFLMMAGIVAVDRGAPAALALGRVELAEKMADSERFRLACLGASRGLPPDGDLIAHLAACVTLQRGCGLIAAKALAKEEMAALGFSSPLSGDRLVDLLAEALPGQAGSEIDRVRPDVIGEALLVREVTGRLRARDPDEAMAIVERAFRRDETNVLETLVLAAQDLAGGAKDHPTVRWLTELANRSTDTSALLRIANAIPSNTLALRELGVLVCGRIVDFLREETGERNVPLLALVLTSLGARLSELRRDKAALDAAQEAVQLRRTLAAARPGVFDPGLATSLGSLAISLGRLGQHDAALAAAHEAAKLYDTLAAAQPDVFNPDLAAALSIFATCLSAVGEHDSALATMLVSVDLRRTLAAKRPDIFRPDLAMSLHNLAYALSNLGRNKKALRAAQEAVGLFRTLAAERSDAFNSSLATCLQGLAGRLGATDEDAALAVAQEGVALHRALADARPDAFNPDLAGSLNNLASHLLAANRSEAALAVAREATKLYRGLADAQPDAFNPDFAGSLSSLAVHLSVSGDNEAALAAAEEAVDLSFANIDERPGVFLPQFARSLSVMGRVLEADGRLEEAAGMDHGAVRALAPSFLALPAAFADTMLAYLGEYYRRSEAAGIELDGELLVSINRKYKELEGGKNDAD